MADCNNEAHGHLIYAHNRLVQTINTLASGGDVSSYLLTVEEWHSVQALGERLNRLEQEQAQAAPVLAAALDYQEACRRWDADEADDLNRSDFKRMRGVLCDAVAAWRAARAAP